jgi:DNA-binding transcriptional LysR family regulator
MIGISPSAVAGAINKLTAVSGMKLFDRHPRGPSLTYEGHRLLEHCRNILSAVEGAGYAMTRPINDITESVEAVRA